MKGTEPDRVTKPDAHAECGDLPSSSAWERRAGRVFQLGQPGSRALGVDLSSLRSVCQPWTGLGVWCALATLLLAWNGVAALSASPFVVLQRYDGIQYQLLARNRLQGHYEVGDTAHTVRQEGRHPMWRPGLVWIEEGLARCLGSVRAGASAASALGTTLMEGTLLWLAWRCFGRAVCGCVLICLLAPSRLNGYFLFLAVGQGPEPWSAAAILAGLATLVMALRQRSWWLALLAGAEAGLAEWFRTGNLLLFAVPCAIQSVPALRRRDRRGFALPALALLTFSAMAGLGGMLVPSPVNKTVANLWATLVELEGPSVPQEFIDRPSVLRLRVLTVVPGTAETFYDHIVRRSREFTVLGFVTEHADAILSRYLQRLNQVLTGGAPGLRWMTGRFVLACFGIQVLLSLLRRDAAPTFALAFAGAALAHLLGPVVYLAGDQPSHYHLVALPLIVVVAACGAVQLAKLADAGCKRWQPALAAWVRQTRWFILGLGVTPLACLSVIFYLGLLSQLRVLHRQAADEQAAVDALGLEGQKVACRNMSWFVDRNILTVLLPYATASELETYARAQKIDGILVWENEPSVFFRATPYDSTTTFDRALQDSDLFGPPQVSGAWRWYPVRPTGSDKGAQAP